MTDGIGKGVASQLGNLVKDIATEVVKAPVKIAGFDPGTQEAKGAGSGGKAHAQGSQQQTRQPSEQIDPMAILREKDEAERQKGLSQARDLLRQFTKPDQSQDPNAPKNIYEAKQLEELEKQKQEIEQEKQNARQILNQPSFKAKRGNLFGKKVKQQKAFGSEQSKNAVHQ